MDEIGQPSEAHPLAESVEALRKAEAQVQDAMQAYLGKMLTVLQPKFVELKLTDLDPTLWTAQLNKAKDAVELRYGRLLKEEKQLDPPVLDEGTGAAISAKSNGNGYYGQNVQLKVTIPFQS